MELKTYGIGGEGTARQPRPFDRVLALFDVGSRPPLRPLRSASCRPLPSPPRHGATPPASLASACENPVRLPCRSYSRANGKCYLFAVRVSNQIVNFSLRCRMVRRRPGIERVAPIQRGKLGERDQRQDVRVPVTGRELSRLQAKPARRSDRVMPVGRQRVFVWLQRIDPI